MAALEKIKSLLKEAVDHGEIAGGSLLVLKNGKELLYAEEGYADQEKQLPIQRDSIFRLYSMTKPVTACAALLLVQQGKLELLDPVGKYLPGFQNQKVAQGDELVPAAREMLVADLLSMTSGLVYPDASSRAGRDTAAVFELIDRELLGDAPISTMEAMNLIGKGALHFQPGSSWCYGTSADVLGAVIEAASGKRFGAFLEEELFAPLGMKDTGFYVPENQRHRLVQVYQRDGKGGLTEYQGNHLGIINKMDRKPAFEAGGAGLVSTADDYGKFAAMLIRGGSHEGKQILSPKMHQYYTSRRLHEEGQKAFALWGPGARGYSYGNLMRIMMDEQQAYVIGSKGEYGWDGWLGTCFCNSPADGLSIIFMTQRTDAGMMPITYRLRNALFCEYGGRRDR
ncbi:CubicO group peptidase (beta-lactamase class C family) [Anaerotaenia torta]|uniref:serine hydrolase domain-containing protein n=1 Tax=Anaerotaenia torta TaxID=433293 RepID=UPI003D201CC7